MGRLKPFIALCLIAFILYPMLPAAAQGTTTHFENIEMGISFDIPADWTVRVESDRLTAGTQADLDLFPTINCHRG